MKRNLIATEIEEKNNKITWLCLDYDDGTYYIVPKMIIYLINFNRKFKIFTK